MLSFSCSAIGRRRSRLPVVAEKSRRTAPAQRAASRLADALDGTSRHMRSGLAWKPKAAKVNCGVHYAGN
jgi:hypothetical protein